MAFGFGDEGIKIRIGADLGPFKRAISQIEQTVGKNIGRFGLDLSRRLTLPLAAIGTASVKAAIDFESAFAGVRKTVDATEEEFAALRKGIQQMSKRLPASANEIAG